MALDCDNSGLSFETLLMMSMRVSGDKNVLDISEAVVADVCEPYILCGGETILTALKKIIRSKRS